MKLKVGQKVFLKEIFGRSPQDKELIKTNIAKVGNKYFTVSDSWRGRFHIDKMMHDGGQYSPKYKAYLSEKEILDENLSIGLIAKIRSIIGQYGKTDLTLDQMKQIINIIAP